MTSENDNTFKIRATSRIISLAFLVHLSSFILKIRFFNRMNIVINFEVIT